MPGNGDREQIFNEVAWNITTTDEEYFAALENNKLGDLKNKGAAQCTERGAMAQQILSLFGTESYYCMGCVDLGDRQEGHCFNIIKRKNDYAVLDYSCPVMSFNREGSVKAYYPFVGTLSNEEFLEFIIMELLKILKIMNLLKVKEFLQKVKDYMLLEHFKLIRKRLKQVMN